MEKRTKGTSDLQGTCNPFPGLDSLDKKTVRVKGQIMQIYYCFSKNVWGKKMLISVKQEKVQM